MTDVKPFICPNCGHFADTVACASHEREKPKTGDVTICVGCGAVNKFGVDLGIEAMSFADWAALSDQLREFVAKALNMRSVVIGDQIKRREREQPRN